ncbi:8260_t:CDS:2, partial [Ambispora leptoticha]
NEINQNLPNAPVLDNDRVQTESNFSHSLDYNPISQWQNVEQVAVCNGCKNQNTRCYPPILTPIPSEIEEVPMMHRRYLSPVHMNCSLGRAAGTNHYTNYRHLEGLIGITHNYRSLQLYSGSIGAYLNSNELSNWFHNSLIPTSDWLKQNNNLIRQYQSNLITTCPSPESIVPVSLP